MRAIMTGGAPQAHAAGFYSTTVSHPRDIHMHPQQFSVRGFVSDVNTPPAYSFDGSYHVGQTVSPGNYHPYIDMARTHTHTVYSGQFTDVQYAGRGSYQGGIYGVTGVSPVAMAVPSVDSQNAGVKMAAAGARNSVKDEKKRSVVCRHWRRGHCRLGELCGFLHKGAPGAQNLCRHWAQGGECRLGMECKFAHDDDAGAAKRKKRANLSGALNRAQDSSAPSPGAAVVTASQDGAAAASVTIPRSKKKLCRHWARGHCNLGDVCLFAHIPSKKGVRNRHNHHRSGSMSSIPDSPTHADQAVVVEAGNDSLSTAAHGASTNGSPTSDGCEHCVLTLADSSDSTDALTPSPSPSSAGNLAAIPTGLVADAKRSDTQADAAIDVSEAASAASV